MGKYIEYSYHDIYTGHNTSVHVRPVQTNRDMEQRRVPYIGHVWPKQVHLKPASETFLLQAVTKRNSTQ